MYFITIVLPHHVFPQILKNTIINNGGDIQIASSL